MLTVAEKRKITQRKAGKILLTAGGGRNALPMPKEAMTEKQSLQASPTSTDK